MLTVEEFGELWEGHGARAVAGYLWKHWGSSLRPEDVEDLTQATALKAWKAAGRFTPVAGHTPRDAFLAWVFTTAHNVAVDHFRAAHAGSRVRGAVSLDSPGESGTGPAYRLPYTEAGYDEVEADAVQAQALRYVSPTSRRIIPHLAEGCTLDEAAVKIGKHPGTVSSTVFRFRRVLAGYRGELMGEAV